jgi:hypothetical protein
MRTTAAVGFTAPDLMHSASAWVRHASRSAAPQLTEPRPQPASASSTASSEPPASQ